MILQRLVGNIYSVLVEIMLWVIPIAGAIAGGIFLSWEMGGGGAVLGIIGGLIGGLLLDVILFGPVIIFMNMRASLKNIENK